jgi:hypothetical protein
MMPPARAVQISGTPHHHRALSLQLAKQKQVDASVLQSTSHILCTSTLMTSLFLGKLAPQDEADACSTGLYDVWQRTWSSEILEAVRRAADVQDGVTTDDLRGKLGEVRTFSSTRRSVDGLARSGSTAVGLCARLLAACHAGLDALLAWSRFRLLRHALRLLSRGSRLPVHRRQPGIGPRNAAQSLRCDRVRQSRLPLHVYADARAARSA